MAKLTLLMISMLCSLLQALQGSEFVELNMVEGKLRRRDNPTAWVIPADQPFTGMLLNFCYLLYCSFPFSNKRAF